MIRILTLALTLQLSLTAASLSRGGASELGFDQQRLQRVDQLVKRFVHEQKHAGISYLILRHGKIAAQQQYGSMNLDSSSEIRQDTIFRIYSMSKVLTSVAALQLVESGQMNLTDDISQWLPELKHLKVQDEEGLRPATHPITVRMLLNHTAGFTYDFFEGSPVHQRYKEADLWNSSSLDAFIRKVAELPLLSEPGEAFHYGIGLDVLGLLIQRVSGESFPDYLRNHITEPLGMHDTGFSVPPEKRNRLASLHQQSTSGKLETTASILGAYADAGRGIPSGGGGLFSTIGDYARFAQMLLNKGHLGIRRLDRVRILGRKTIELALENSLTETATPYNEFSPSDGWGLLGAVRLDVGKSQELGSKGMFYWSGAATTHFFVDPKEQLIGLVFSQHVPFDQHHLFSPFRNTVYQALK